MRIDVVSLFPEWIAGLREYGVVGRGLRESRPALHTWNPRDRADNASGRVDDRPYGGGPGMVMDAPTLARTLDAVAAARGDDRAPVILLSPQGHRFDQAWAERLAAGPGFVLCCGRYEGVDPARLVFMDKQPQHEYLARLQQADLFLDTNPYINLLDHFVAGDGRANENIGLTAMHTVWARNHNFHVEELLARTG